MMKENLTMDYKKLIAAAAALTMLSSFAACGKDAETDDVSGDTPVIAIDGDDESDTEETSEKDDEDESPDADTKSGSKTTTVSSGSKSTATTAAKGASTGNSASGGASKGGSSSGGGSFGGSSSGGGSPAKTTAAASGGGSQAAVTTAASSSEETKSYDAEISFNGSPTVKGSNAAAVGSVVKITAGGSYHITGSTSDGQIYVSTATEEKVKIVLDGVNITCSTGPAIFIDEAKKCTVELADGSSNYLRDTIKDKVNDGVIFSNDTLRIKGGGYLEITAGNAHGIASDDDVIIESGTYVISSVKSGIFAHDDITINDGDLTIYGGTNGIKSKGTVNINGGYSLISGGTKEEKSSVYAGAALNYTGGYVFAAGNKVTAPATSANPYIVVSYPNTGAAGSTLRFVLDGSERAVLTPHNPFKCALMLSPDIRSGSSFVANLNGADSATFTVTDTQNVFTVD